MADYRAEAEANRVRQCLATHGNRFDYQKTLGQGCFGVACLIRHNRRDGTSRDFVVKRALREMDQRNLQNEVNIAKEIGGGLHFAMPIHIEANPLQQLGGPIMTMEYLANGTLGDFINRSQSMGFPLPNRLLWRLFGCLFRFVAGMAFPVRWQEGQEQVLENLPEVVHRQSGTRLVHGDIHPWNILIGDCPDNNEHSRVPILKLVDFGQAYIHPPTGNNYNDAIAMNVFSVGEIMLGLIEQQPYTAMVVDARGRMVPRHRAGGVWIKPAGIAGPGVRVDTYAAPYLFDEHGSWRNAHADREMQLLVARCLAVAARDRPGLQALADAIAAGRRRGAHDYRHLFYAENEASDVVGRVVRDFMLQAPAPIVRDVLLPAPAPLPAPVPRRVPADARRRHDPHHHQQQEQRRRSRPRRSRSRSRFRQRRRPHH